MRQTIDRFTRTTRGKGFVDITPRARAFVEQSGMSTGLLTVFCRHTSASLTIQENADPTVRADLRDFLERIAPEDGDYVHDLEGPDDMPAHIRTMLTAATLSVPVDQGRLVLGTWQAIYLCEHRRRPHEREIVMHLFGE